MTWLKTMVNKAADLYASKLVVRVGFWVVISGFVLMMSTITVQALVLRKYKRTIYKLRAVTMQLKAERDVAREKLTQARAENRIKLLERKDREYSRKRMTLLGKIQKSKKIERELSVKLKSRLSKIDDLKIEQLLKNSRVLQEALNGSSPFAKKKAIVLKTTTPR